MCRAEHIPRPMIIAADWLSISTNLLLVVEVVICLLLCLVVLMQRPKQEGLGAAFGGGMTDQAFGARTTDVLQKGTVYLGTLFFLVTFALSVLASANTREQLKAENAANAAKVAEEAKAEQLADEATQDEVNAATAPDADETAPEADETPAADTPEADTAAPVEEAAEEEAGE